MKLVLKHFLFLFFILVLGNVFSQGTVKNNIRANFQASETQQYGFDSFEGSQLHSSYDTLFLENQAIYLIPFKSVGYDETDEVDAIISGIDSVVMDSLYIETNAYHKPIRFVRKNDSTFTLFLPKRTYKYGISVFYNSQKCGALNVLVYKPIITKVIIVPLIHTQLNKNTIQNQLDEIYRPANVLFDVQVGPFFGMEQFKKEVILDNPSTDNDRFTDQMIDIRDSYLDAHPEFDKKAYYVFIVDGFVNPKVKGYMVLNKAVAFVSYSEKTDFAKTIARQLGHGIGMLKDSWKDNGPKKGSTNNLMDVNQGFELSAFQWENIRHASNSFSFFDNYENVKTNSGTVAYYFWQEDKFGNIILEKDSLLISIHRPYKKNYKSYHLDIGFILFEPLFVVGDYLICSLHLIALLVVLIVSYLLRRKFHRYLRYKLRRNRIWRMLSRVGFIVIAFGSAIWLFFLINQGYDWFEVKGGILKELKNTSFSKAEKAIMYNKNVKHKAEKSLCSETLIKRGENWHMNKRKNVLYFELKQDSVGRWTKCRYKIDNDSLLLSTFGYYEKAESHYVVFNYLNEKNAYVEQKVYNHLGKDITAKIKLENPIKRILVFVNGYRPTSIGHSFEDNFADIKKNGLEFPNSDNMVYDFDRYDYWQPWNQINLLFQKRINPSETYYADGHFSVSTSNHGSLINFTTLASKYPKRCKNPKKHTCFTTTIAGTGLLGSKISKTSDLLRLSPNIDGFNERMEGGRIAGKNLLILLNEIPNKSDNDTLYIVAHSMGYAYSLGIIEVLRGKINFGGFYILAPENASSGKLRMNEWQEIWQYGAKFNSGESEPACMQDGVAPQSRCGGLSADRRIYIPAKNYKKRGFFDSHFVGYFDWILKIQKGNRGYVSQH